MGGRAVRKKILIGLLIALLLAAAGVSAYHVFDWQIPPGQKLVALHVRDVFQGRHTALGEGAQAVVVTVEGIRETDRAGRETLYAFTSEAGDGSFWYPGTPKGQVYGYPRLRRGERLVLIAGEIGEGMKAGCFWLFRIGTADGEETVYPLFYDDAIIPLTALGDSLSFADEAERSIYDPWYDEDVFKYLAKTGRTAPAYKYKTTLDNLMKNVGKLTRSGGR